MRMVPMVVADPDLKQLCMADKLLMCFQLIRLTLESKFCLLRFCFGHTQMSGVC